MRSPGIDDPTNMITQYMVNAAHATYFLSTGINQSTSIDTHLHFVFSEIFRVEVLEDFGPFLLRFFRCHIIRFCKLDTF